MSAASNILRYLLEASDEEEDFDVKDVVEPGRDIAAGKTSVKRHGRMKIVDMAGYTFLISFLTPVAFLDKNTGTYYQTTKQWSPTTSQHISDWQRMIWDSPEWKDNPNNMKTDEYGTSVGYPQFKRMLQKRITELFRTLMLSMELKPRDKRRMYHVNPRMRQASREVGWLSGHLKHHDSGEEGLPRPDDYHYGKFFTDFDPDEPKIYDWGTGLRDTTPHELYKPDE